MDTTTVVFTSVSIIITVVSVFIAIFSLRESKIARKAMKQPLLVLENVFGELIITNVGQAPAFNISIKGKYFNLGEFVEDLDLEWSYSYILPGKSETQNLEDKFGDFASIQVIINFESIFKDRYELQYEVSLNLQSGGLNVKLLDSKTI